jgi:hypothetical protein
VLFCGERLSVRHQKCLNPVGVGLLADPIGNGDGGRAAEARLRFHVERCAMELHQCGRIVGG